MPALTAIASSGESVAAAVWPVARLCSSAAAVPSASTARSWATWLSSSGHQAPQTSDNSGESATRSSSVGVRSVSSAMAVLLRAKGHDVAFHNFWAGIPRLRARTGLRHPDRSRFRDDLLLGVVARLFGEHPHRHVLARGLQRESALPGVGHLVGLERKAGELDPRDA